MALRWDVIYATQAQYRATSEKYIASPTSSTSGYPGTSLKMNASRSKTSSDDTSINLNTAGQVPAESSTSSKGRNSTERSVALTLLGIYPVYLDPNLTGCQVNKIYLQPVGEIRAFVVIKST